MTLQAYVYDLRSAVAPAARAAAASLRPRAPREGRSLERLLAERNAPLAVEEVIALGVRLCEALERLHHRGEVHGQVVPSRVLISRSLGGIERVELARPADLPDGRRSAYRPDLGPPGCLSPEYLLSMSLDARADVYGVGATLFECLAGRAPYEGDLEKVLKDVYAFEAERPDLASACPGVPHGLAEVVMRALERPRGLRFPDVPALAAALRSAMPHLPVGTRLLAPVPSSVPTIRPTGSEPPAASEERRRTTRAPYVAPVRVVLGGLVIDGRSEDISAEGLLVVVRGVAPAGCRRGAPVRVRFPLPLNGLVADTSASVRWVRALGRDRTRGLFAMGLELLGASPAMRGSIDRYVELMGDELGPSITEC
jgi:hypothetical protein